MKGFLKGNEPPFTTYRSSQQPTAWEMDMKMIFLHQIQRMAEFGFWSNEIKAPKSKLI
jgi:hypothetical protein